MLSLYAALAMTGTINVQKEYPSQVVSCYNQSTGEITKSLNGTNTGCHKGKNYSNLRIPSSKQMKLAKSIFKNKQDLAIFLALGNHESQYDSNARGKNKWGYDCGILQIRDINGGCKMSDKQQMEWLKKVLDERRSKTGRCRSYYKEQGYGMTRCIFNRHNGQTKTINGYSSRLLKYYEFYIKKLN